MNAPSDSGVADAAGGSVIQTAPAPERTALRAERRRSGSWFAIVLALLALGIGAYALHRSDRTRDRLEEIRDSVRESERVLSVLSNEVDAIGQREQEERQSVRERLDRLAALPERMEDLAGAIDELRGRSESPEQAWLRAEALFLIELAERSLAFARDVDAAIAALEAAEQRLATRSEPLFVQVRQKIAADLQALRAVPQADRRSLVTRLSAAEEAAAALPLRGRSASRSSAGAAEPARPGALRRAWSVIKQAFHDLLTVRRLDDRSIALLTQEQAAVVRQHLTLELLAARVAVVQADQPAYLAALTGARSQLEESFDTDHAAVAALVAELSALADVDLEPALPDISGSRSLLSEASE